MYVGKYLIVLIFLVNVLFPVLMVLTNKYNFIILKLPINNMSKNVNKQL